MKQRYKQKSAVVEAILLSQGDTFKVFHDGGKDVSFMPKEQFLAAYELDGATEKNSVVVEKLEVKEEAGGEKPLARKFK